MQTVLGEVLARLLVVGRVGAGEDAASLSDAVDCEKPVRAVEAHHDDCLLRFEAGGEACRAKVVALVLELRPSERVPVAARRLRRKG